MLEHFVELFLEILIPVCELMGITIVAISAFSAFWQYAKSLVLHVPSNVKFQLANGLALSLEFKMAAEILKTDLAFMGLELSEGTHTVELRYFTPYFAFGILLSIIGWGIFVIWIVIDLYRCKKKGQ